jgi:hypothetical protein
VQRWFPRLALVIVAVVALGLPAAADGRSPSEGWMAKPPTPNLEGLTKQQRRQALDNQRTLLRRWQKKPSAFLHRPPPRLRAVKPGRHGSIRTADAAAISGPCQAQPYFAYNRNFTLPSDPDAITMSWIFHWFCFHPIPTIMGIASSMIEPNGTNHASQAVGDRNVAIGSTATGPEGTWNWIVNYSAVLPPPWIWTGSGCAGIGTNVATCWWGVSIPIFVP